MESAEACRDPVLRLFGRTPTSEDLRCVGRWSYAATWIAEDRTTARDLVRARMTCAATFATSAATKSGKGDAERFALVNAIARLGGALMAGTGPLAAATERAVEESATALLRDGKTLRTATGREHAAIATIPFLDAFTAAMHDSGPERHVLFREVSSKLDEALIDSDGPFPALRTLRLYLRATLALDASETPDLDASATTQAGRLFATLGAWLSGDLALASRRATAYQKAWSAAARCSGDALSRIVAGLASDAMLTKGVADAMAEDPWALPLALGMTSEPEHASVLLEFGAHVQTHLRRHAAEAVGRWAAEVVRLAEFEERLGVLTPVTTELREGHQEFASCGSLDLFAVWHVARRAEEARTALRDAMDLCLATETSGRREAVRRAKETLQRLREAYENDLESARARAEEPLPPPDGLLAAEASANRGCFVAVGSAFAVMAVYAVVSLTMGSNGIVGRLAPVVLGVAAIPGAASVVAQIAVSLRRSRASREASRRRSARAAQFKNSRAVAERSHAEALAKGRDALTLAEERLTALDRRAAGAR